MRSTTGGEGPLGGRARSTARARSRSWRQCSLAVMAGIFTYCRGGTASWMRMSCFTSFATCRATRRMDRASVRATRNVHRTVVYRAVLRCQLLRARTLSRMGPRRTSTAITRLYGTIPYHIGGNLVYA
eukprot:30022-Prorocentrum_minimum.AAC.5